MRSILLLDNDRRTGREIGRLLTAQHQVFLVRTLAAALRLFSMRKPEVVLVRSTGQDCDAITLLECLRIWRARVPVVVLVGDAAADEVVMIRRSGAIAVVRWPARSKRLLAAVETGLRHQRVLDDAANRTRSAKLATRVRGRHATASAALKARRAVCVN